MSTPRTAYAGERKLTEVVWALAGIIGISAGVCLTVFLIKNNDFRSLLEQLSGVSAFYRYAAVGTLILIGLVFLLYILLGIGALFSLVKCGQGRRLKRSSLFLLAALFLLGAAGLEIGGKRVLMRLLPERAVTEFDLESIDLLIRGSSLALLLCGLSKAALSLSLTKKKNSRRRPVLMTVCCLAALWLSSFALLCCYRFSAAGMLFSSVFSRAMNLRIDAQLLVFFCDGMFLLSCLHILYAMTGRKKRKNVPGIFTLIGALCLFFTAFIALKNFANILCRYRLYSKYISIFTLVRQPLTALCLLVLDMAILSSGRRVILFSSLVLCLTEAYALLLSRTPVLLSSFSAAFETALPILLIAYWGSLALGCFVAGKTQSRALRYSLRTVCFLLAAAPAVLAVIYNVKNLSYIREYTSAGAIVESLLTIYLLPAVGKSAAVVRL